MPCKHPERCQFIKAEKERLEKALRENVTMRRQIERVEALLARWLSREETLAYAEALDAALDVRGEDKLGGTD